MSAGTALERLEVAGVGVISVQRVDVDRIWLLRKDGAGTLILVPLSMTADHRAQAGDLLWGEERAAFDAALATDLIW